jgi:hypothetical protein
VKYGAPSRSLYVRSGQVGELAVEIVGRRQAEISGKSGVSPTFGALASLLHSRQKSFASMPSNLGDPLARRVDAREHGKLRSLDVVEQQRLAELDRRLRDGGELVLRVDLAIDVNQIATGVQGCHEIAHLDSPCGRAFRPL